MRPEPSTPIDKKAIQVWRLSGAIGTLIVSLPLPIAVLILLITDFFDWPIVWPIMFGYAVFCFLLGLFTILLIPPIRWRRWRYDIYQSEIDLQQGLFVITRTLIPMVRIQHVDTSQGPLLRRYGLAEVTISTAAGTHSIPALTKETANELRELILGLAKVGKEDV